MKLLEQHLIHVIDWKQMRLVLVSNRLFEFLKQSKFFLSSLKQNFQSLDYDTKLLHDGLLPKKSNNVTSLLGRVSSPPSSSPRPRPRPRRFRPKPPPRFGRSSSSSSSKLRRESCLRSDCGRRLSSSVGSSAI